MTGSCRLLTLLFTLAVTLVLGFGNGGARTLAQVQQPQPQPQENKPQIPGIKPLVMIGVSMNGGVLKPVGTFTELQRPIPEYTFPRDPFAAASWVLEFRTRDGRGSINFSHTLSGGVAASALQWEQSTGSPPAATARLRYTGCVNCPASFTISVIAKDFADSAGAQVKINLTDSRAAARLRSIVPDGGGSVRPRFRLTFEQGTFTQSDSHVNATYPGALRYRLTPESLGTDSMTVVIPRLKQGRSLRVAIGNPLGGSDLPTELPAQSSEGNPPFECINCSTPCVNCSGAFTVTLGDTYSISHNHLNALESNGTDTIVLTPKQTGSTPCDQDDFIYTGSRVSILVAAGNANPTTNGPGSAQIDSQPTTSALLRAPDNRIRIRWSKPGATGDWWYQVVPSGVTVVGVCSNRIIQ